MEEEEKEEEQKSYAAWFRGDTYLGAFPSEEERDEAVWGAEDAHYGRHWRNVTMVARGRHMHPHQMLRVAALACSPKNKPSPMFRAHRSAEVCSARHCCRRVLGVSLLW